MVNDIALIELKNKTRFNISFANSVCSPNSSEPTDRSEIAVVAGWGNFDGYFDGWDPPNTLMMTTFDTIPPNDCKYKTDSLICADSSGGMSCPVKLHGQNIIVLYFLKIY